MTEPSVENDASSVQKEHLIELSADIVSAYVANNPVSTVELPNLIQEVHSTLERMVSSAENVAAPAGNPAVPVKKSVQDDYIICLEDGKKFRSLKRHLRSHFDMSPEEYREKWGLPADYPMVAPNYAKARSKLAKEMGLGRKPGARLAAK